MTCTEQDQRLMRLAVDLASCGKRTVRSNPLVGCVIVNDGEVVGQGFHRRRGEAHAEVHALDHAGERARGGTAYVSLEPCAHHGLTGPCVERVISAGISRVVIGARDPYPEVDGRSVARLRAAGVTVTTAVCTSDVVHQNRGFFSRLRRGRPWVVAKMACSLDGKTALRSGESKWITGVESRLDVHRLRAEYGAILTGAGTLREDDPSLTVRTSDGREFSPPIRVVLGARHCDVKGKRVTDAGAPSLFFCHEDEEGWDDDRVVRTQGLQGRPDAGECLRALSDRGINNVLVEAGPTLVGALLQQGLIDELVVYIAPVILGSEGRPLLLGNNAPNMASIEALQRTDCAVLGTDLRTTYFTAASAAFLRDLASSLSR